jgi:hypothetical protein
MVLLGFGLHDSAGARDNASRWELPACWTHGDVFQPFLDHWCDVQHQLMGSVHHADASERSSHAGAHRDHPVRAHAHARASLSSHPPATSLALPRPPALVWMTMNEQCAAKKTTTFRYQVLPAPCTLHPAPCTLPPAPCPLHPAPCIAFRYQVLEIGTHTAAAATACRSPACQHAPTAMMHRRHATTCSHDAPRRTTLHHRQRHDMPRYTNATPTRHQRYTNATPTLHHTHGTAAATRAALCRAAADTRPARRCC